MVSQGTRSQQANPNTELSRQTLCLFSRQWFRLYCSTLSSSPQRAKNKNPNWRYFRSERLTLHFWRFSIRNRTLTHKRTHAPESAAERAQAIGWATFLALPKQGTASANKIMLKTAAAFVTMSGGWVGFMTLWLWFFENFENYEILKFSKFDKIPWGFPWVFLS